MTVQELLALVRARRDGCLYTDNQMTEDLNRFEAQIQAEIYDLYEQEMPIITYTGTEMLRVPSPWDEMYFYLLLGKIDYADGEIDDYNNDMSRHMDILTGYKNYYARTHTPKGQHINPFGRRERKCNLPL